MNGLGVEASPAPHFLTSPHALTLMGWAVFTGVVIWVGLRTRGTGRAWAFDRGVGVLTLLAYLTVNVWWLWPTHLEPDQSLPIQLCDLAALCAPLAILARWRVARALLYFWGLGLSTQGFITPVTRVGPEHGEFWMHWLNHGAIVGAALYDLAVLRFRPTWRDWRLAVGLGLVYLAGVFALNVVTGWNYGYVGSSRPEARTIVDFLGPWPWRVVWIAAIAIAGMAALMIPWVLAGHLRRDGAQTGGAGGAGA